MVKDATGELHVAAIQAMLEVAADLPEQFAELYKGQLAWLKFFLSHTDATGGTQKQTASTIGLCLTGLRVQLYTGFGVCYAVR